MSFEKTLFASFLVGFFVLSLAAETSLSKTAITKVAKANLTRHADRSEVNNFPVNALPPLTYSPKKYTFYSTSVSFYQAWHLCRSKGKRLAAIENYQDHEAYKKAVAPHVGFFTSHWIAATNLGAPSNEYDKFYWITNDRPVGYISGFEGWFTGVPPNDPNQCVATYLASALWIYGTCATSTSYYACEESQDV
uniref:C-type lectin domain-containing protein n=1 Tax=Anopheles minimus TaxID=112268 RepID=A0A182WCR3_9DIPT